MPDPGMDRSGRPGVLLTFEGMEGSGKTTQVRRLAARLEGGGHRVRIVREPGGTSLSEKVRAVLLDRGSAGLSPWSELCLYVAARAQLVEEVVRPALERGEVVLADRYGDSSVVYQGIGREIGIEPVQTLNAWATGGLVPRCTVVFDVPPEIGLRRAATRGGLDRMEAEPAAFHRRVREGFLELARREPERVRVLDGTRTEDEVFAELWALVSSRMVEP